MATISTPTSVTINPGDRIWIHTVSGAAVKLSYASGAPVGVLIPRSPDDSRTPAQQAVVNWGDCAGVAPIDTTHTPGGSQVNAGDQGVVDNAANNAGIPQSLTLTPQGTSTVELIVNQVVVV